LDSITDNALRFRKLLHLPEVPFVIRDGVDEDSKSATLGGKSLKPPTKEKKSDPKAMKTTSTTNEQDTGSEPPVATPALLARLHDSLMIQTKEALLVMMSRMGEVLPTAGAESTPSPFYELLLTSLGRASSERDSRW